MIYTINSTHIALAMTFDYSEYKIVFPAIAKIINDYIKPTNSDELQDSIDMLLEDTEYLAKSFITDKKKQTVTYSQGGRQYTVNYISYIKKIYNEQKIDNFVRLLLQMQSTFTSPVIKNSKFQLPTEFTKESKIRNKLNLAYAKQNNQSS